MDSSVDDDAQCDNCKRSVEEHVIVITPDMLSIALRGGIDALGTIGKLHMICPTSLFEFNTTRVGER